MSLKSKAKAAKRREQLKKERELEQERIAANAKKLKTMTAGFSRSKVSASTKARFEASKMPQYVKKKQVKHASEDLHDRFAFVSAKTKPSVMGHMTPEMQRREQAAQERLREIKKRVDIGYNKGGLMLLSESEFKAMQRGELKRRS